MSSLSNNVERNSLGISEITRNFDVVLITVAKLTSNMKRQKEIDSEKRVLVTVTTDNSLLIRYTTTGRVIGFLSPTSNLEVLQSDVCTVSVVYM